MRRSDGVAGIFVGAGRDAGIRRADLVGPITAEARIAAREFGAIEIAAGSLVEARQVRAGGIDVPAESLFEAAALGLAALKRDEWTDLIGSEPVDFESVAVIVPGVPGVPLFGGTEEGVSHDMSNEPVPRHPVVLKDSSAGVEGASTTPSVVRLFAMAAPSSP